MIEVIYLGFADRKRSVTPELGNFVVCSLLVKDTTKWPSNKSFTKHFVGKICELKGKNKIKFHHFTSPWRVLHPLLVIEISNYNLEQLSLTESYATCAYCLELSR